MFLIEHDENGTVVWRSSVLLLELIHGNPLTRSLLISLT